LRTDLNRHGIAANIAVDADGARLDLADTSVARAVAALCPRAARSLETPHASTETALLPTHAAESQARAQRIEQHLKQRIEQLPGVQTASVLVALPPTQNRLRDLLEPAESARPSVTVSLLRSKGAAASATLAGQVRTAALNAMPDTPSNHVEVTVHEQVAPDACEPCAALAHIGAVTVTDDSIVTLKVWLASSLVLHMLGASALLLLALQRRRANQR
jgi:type III secretory pathway lipoprotein EscJ